MSPVDPTSTFINFFTPENEAFYSANPYKPLDPANHEFRILEVLPGDVNDLVECKLIEPPHVSGLSYDCISYRAGDPKNILQIKVNGHPFNTFATLGAALRRLRLLDRSRLLWADQIVINQSDVAERSSQVQQMREFYERADTVHAWLEHLENGAVAVQELRCLESQFNDAYRLHVETTDNHKSLSPLERQSICERIAHSLKDRLSKLEENEIEKVHAQCSALGQMFRSEFWERLWIMQEIFVAKSVNLVWDSCSINLAEIDAPLDILSSLLDNLDRDRDPAPVPKSIECLVGRPTDRFYTYILTISRYRHHRSQWKQRGSLDFKTLLSFSKGTRCSDPRDRIFGLLGLVSRQYDITPDYTESVQAAYSASTLSIIVAEKSLDVLAYCKLPHSDTSTKRLPTWCPDWSSRVNMSTRRSDLLWDEYNSGACKFQASKKAESQLYWLCGPEENGLFAYIALHTEGILLGTVQQIGQITRPRGETTGDSFQNLLESCSELIAQKRSLTPDVVQDLEKTITVDDRGYPNVMLPRGAIDASNYERLKLDAVEGNRKFIVTGSGYMGMAPRQVEVGDSACVLVGARVPFLLRKRDGEEFYNLVGELYLSDGFMDGKAIDMMEAGQFCKVTVELR